MLAFSVWLKTDRTFMFAVVLDIVFCVVVGYGAVEISGSVLQFSTSCVVVPQIRVFWLVRRVDFRVLGFEFGWFRDFTPPFRAVSIQTLF